MKSKDYKYVLELVECEGFDYAFRHYSDFEEIKDAEFHKLRQAYLKAAQDLIDFVGLEDE